MILDLEDAVAPNEKGAARERVVFLNSGARAWVRVNDASSDLRSADCRALADCRGRADSFAQLMRMSSRDSRRIGFN